MMKTRRAQPEQVYRFVDELLGESMHVKRVASLANATLGVMRSASLAVNTIGQGLALAKGLGTKHAIKQVDRLLSNPGIEVDDVLVQWVPYVIGARSNIVVAMDWTDFDADGQSTIMLSLLTDHGHGTPLVWLTVDKASLKKQRNDYEYQVLVRPADVLPADVKVLIVADRGFGDQKLYQVLTHDLKFDYVIRFRGCLATNLTDVNVKTLISYYAKRWGIECSFRDAKDLRFTPERRDRLWLLSALAIALLTLLGAAGEALGLDRMLKSNTSKKRTHSLFRQGCMLYELIPMMPEQRLQPLMEKFGAMLLELPAFSGLFGSI